MKKFYEKVTVTEEEGGFAVQLDGRGIKTPGKAALLMPSEALAKAVAAEWDAQAGEVLPDTMPMTQQVNTVIDRVAPRKEEVVQELVAYTHTDLLCYRAVDQDELVVSQARTWQPFLDWLKDTLGVELEVTNGIVPLTQSDTAIKKIANEVASFDSFSLSAFHAFVSGFGSIVLALALVRGFRDFDACWAASLLDESHQEALWGLDAEVEEARNRKREELLASLDLWHFVQG